MLCSSVDSALLVYHFLLSIKNKILKKYQKPSRIVQIITSLVVIVSIRVRMCGGTDCFFFAGGGSPTRIAHSQLEMCENE